MERARKRRRVRKRISPTRVAAAIVLCGVFFLAVRYYILTSRFHQAIRKVRRQGISEVQRELRPENGTLGSINATRSPSMPPPPSQSGNQQLQSNSSREPWKPLDLSNSTGPAWVTSFSVRTPSIWPRPPKRPGNGYVFVRCNGGLNQQRAAICNAVVVARIMNATLVVPRLDTNAFWRDNSSFASVYDVAHFIHELAPDVRIVKKLPKKGRKPGFKIVKSHPPREAIPSWYATVAVKKLKRNGAISFTPFAHRLAEELAAATSPNASSHGASSLSAEWQRLRCRVNYAALRFVPAVHAVADRTILRLRSGTSSLSSSVSGSSSSNSSESAMPPPEALPFVAVHLRFEKDMLAFAGCFDIFSLEEQKVLSAYRRQNFAEKELEPVQRRRMGKCPLTPLEVGLVLRAAGYPPSTRLFLATGEVFGGDKYLAPLRAIFPNLLNRTSILPEAERAEVDGNGRGLLGQAVDYLVCVKADAFLPTYDGPSNFANNVLGHRMASGFRPSLLPDRRILARLLLGREKGDISDSEFNTAVAAHLAHQSTEVARPRADHESVFAHPFPECFCRPKADAGCVGNDNVATS